MDLQDFWSALWAIAVALAVCSLAIATVYAWWPEIGELFGKQRPVKIRIKRAAPVAGEAAARHVSPPPFSQPAKKGFDRANAHKLAAALDDIGGTRLVSSNVVPGPWRIQ